MLFPQGKSRDGSFESSHYVETTQDGSLLHPSQYVIAPAAIIIITIIINWMTKKKIFSLLKKWSYYCILIASETGSRHCKS